MICKIYLCSFRERSDCFWRCVCVPYKRTVPKSEEMLDGWNSFVTAGDLISVEMYRNPDLEGVLDLLRESRREAMGSILWVCSVIEMSAM